MNTFAIVAIYMLFWVMSAFLVMPIGVRTPDETGDELVNGQAPSAPSNFRPKRIVLRATILSTLLFGFYYANYVNGWVTIDDINLVKYVKLQ